MGNFYPYCQTSPKWYLYLPEMANVSQISSPCSNQRRYIFMNTPRLNLGTYIALPGILTRSQQPFCYSLNYSNRCQSRTHTNVVSKKYCRLLMMFWMIGIFLTFVTEIEDDFINVSNQEWKTPYFRKLRKLFVAFHISSSLLKEECDLI